MNRPPLLTDDPEEYVHALVQTAYDDTLSFEERHLAARAAVLRLADRQDELRQEYQRERRRAARRRHPGGSNVVRLGPPAKWEDEPWS